MRTYRFKAFLVCIALASAGPVRAEVAAMPAYRPCEYARNLILNPTAFYVGGAVGAPWLQAAVCQETAEDCELIGRLCGSGAGYEDLDRLCQEGTELKVCVPKSGPTDPSGVCVSLTDGCGALADSCHQATCSFGAWTPNVPPEPVVPGDGIRVQFALQQFDRPVACVVSPKDNGPPSCERGANFQIPPPPPTEHPCDEYEWNSKEWWCCVDASSPQCKSGSGDYVACTDPADCPGGGTGGNTGGTGSGGTGPSGDTGGAGGESPEPHADLAPGECLVTPQDTEAVNGKLIGVTKEGTGISLLVEYRAPEGLAGDHSEIVQTAGPAVSVLGPSGIVFAPNSSWTVQMGRPEKMYGEFIPNAAFLVTVYDAGGKILHQAACAEEAGIHSQGGSGGCSLTEDGAPGDAGAILGLGLLAILAVGCFKLSRNF